MKARRKNKSGQTIVEYIIIVVIIAIAAIAVVGVFGDRIRAMFGGATVELGGLQADVDKATDTSSADWLKSLQKTGATP
jgi:Flp pilus assembly pilin Flp